MLVLYSILLILLLQTDLLIGHGLMAEKQSGNTIGWLCHHSLCSGPMTALIVLIIISYRNKVPSLVRCGLQNISNSRTFRLLDPASVSRGQLKQKDIFFSRETNHHAIICCTYKTGHYCAHPLPITFAFDYSPSVLLFPSPSRSMANTSVPHPTSLSTPSINDDDSGYNSATECRDGDFVFSDPWRH
jgi:hypothetical protein